MRDSHFIMLMLGKRSPAKRFREFARESWLSCETAFHIPPNAIREAGCPGQDVLVYLFLDNTWIALYLRCETAVHIMKRCDLDGEAVLAPWERCPLCPREFISCATFVDLSLRHRA